MEWILSNLIKYNSVYWDEVAAFDLVIWSDYIKRSSGKSLQLPPFKLWNASFNNFVQFFYKIGENPLKNLIKNDREKLRSVSNLLVSANKYIEEKLKEYLMKNL